MAKAKKIDWKQAAKHAAKFASEVLSEAHRDVIPWHGPTNTWLAFDTQCPDKDVVGYLAMLCDSLGDYEYEIWASALSEGNDSLAVLFTSDPDGPGDDDFETARMLLWELWHGETDMIIDALPKRKQKGARKHRDLQEVVQRKTAAARIERYLMEQPCEWDRELEKTYRANSSR